MIVAQLQSLAEVMVKAALPQPHTITFRPAVDPGDGKKRELVFRTAAGRIQYSERFKLFDQILFLYLDRELLLDCAPAADAAFDGGLSIDFSRLVLSSLRRLSDKKMKKLFEGCKAVEAEHRGQRAPVQLENANNAMGNLVINFFHHSRKPLPAFLEEYRLTDEMEFYHSVLALALSGYLELRPHAETPAAPAAEPAPPAPEPPHADSATLLDAALDTPDVKRETLRRQVEGLQKILGAVKRL